MAPALPHGGDWAGYQEKFGKEPLDFSANISPLGLPDGVREAAAAALTRSERYPDPLCRALRRAIGQAEGVDENWCLCGNGAADLIYRAALAIRPRRAVVTAPAFSEYESALALTGCETRRYLLEETNDFSLDEGFLEAVEPGTELVFLGQPNNPTGRTVPRPLLLQILERCRQVGAVLAVDECFCDFLEAPEKFTMNGLLKEYPNLLLLKAFTKLYAMAGLRLGYCLCADEDLLARMYAAGQPWAVSAPAQAAGIAALGEGAYVERVRTLLTQARPALEAGLRALGFRVVPGEANYLLFYSEIPLLEPLAKRGILLRSCQNYHGLGAGWYRAAVRTTAENRRLLQALSEIGKEGRP